MVMKKILATLVLFAGLQLSFGQISRDVGSFNVVRAYDKIPVELIPGTTNSVEVTGGKADFVQVVNKNGDLKIRMSSEMILSGDDVRVKVIYNGRLREIQGSQGSRITSPDTISGSLLSLISNEGSTIDLNLNVKSLDVKGSTGGVVNVHGTTSNQIVLMNAGATYNGEDMKSDVTTVTVNAGGNAIVYAGESVDAKTRAGGTIKVFGNPAQRKTRTIAGGTITFN